MYVRWIACPLAISMLLVLLTIAASESSGISTPTKPQCSLPSSDGLEKVLCLIQEESLDPFVMSSTGHP
jgi:hypothetical protein